MEGGDGQVVGEMKRGREWLGQEVREGSETDKSWWFGLKIRKKNKAKYFIIHVHISWDFRFNCFVSAFLGSISAKLKWLLTSLFLPEIKVKIRLRSRMHGGWTPCLSSSNIWSLFWNFTWCRVNWLHCMCVWISLESMYVCMYVCTVVSVTRMISDTWTYMISTHVYPYSICRIQLPEFMLLLSELYC